MGLKFTKRRVWSTITLAIFLVVGALAWWQATPPIPSSIKAIAALGIPTTYAELEASAKRDGKDAGPAYDSFELAWQDLGALSATWGVLQQQDKNETLEDRARAADKLRYLAMPLLEGSKQPQWSLPHEQFVDESGNPHSDRRSLAANSATRFLCAMGRTDYERGRRQDGLAELKAAADIAHQFGANPDMLKAVQSYNFESIVLSSADRILSQHKNDAAAGSEIEGLVKGFGDLPSVRNAIIETFNRTAEVLEVSERLGEKLYGDQRRTLKEVLDDMVDKRRLTLEIAAYRDAFERLPRGDWTWEQAREAFETTDKKFRGKIGYDGSAEHIVEMMDSWGRRTARRRMTLCAARLIKNRGKAQSFPAALPNWGHDSTDPFSGSQLKYRVIGNTFTIYSVGKNRVDDGGTGKRLPEGGWLDVERRY